MFAKTGARMVNNDTMPQLPPAGITHVVDNENTAQCLKYQDDPSNDRPPTPDNIKKYRNTYKGQPGLRFTHTGLVDQSLPPSQHRYGVRTAMGDGAKEVMDQAAKTELQEFMNEQREAHYQSKQREPLGRGYSRGHQLPESTKDDKFRFGAQSSSSESAKNLIYFDEPVPDKRARSLAAEELAHSDNPHTTERDITRQINRQYNWESPGIDPATHRFGKGNPVIHGGVASALKHDDDTKIASKRVQQVRSATHDRLGKGREVRGNLRNLGEDFVFGKVSTTDEWGAKKCMQGNYPLEQQMPDADLGRSVRGAERLPEHARDRAFGVPSIRTDLAVPTQRSVADPQNYGNEADCKGLIYPGKFATDGVDEDDFLLVRNPHEVREIFRKIGQEFSDDEFNQICDLAAKEFGGLSADSFRHAWNKIRMGPKYDEYTSAPTQKFQQLAL